MLISCQCYTILQSENLSSHRDVFNELLSLELQHSSPPCIPSRQLLPRLAYPSPARQSTVLTGTATAISASNICACPQHAGSETLLLQFRRYTKGNKYYPLSITILYIKSST